MGTMTGPIGVIDSGIGGLSVVTALRDLLPQEDIVYIADPKYFPYGEKTTEELLCIIRPFFSFFLDEFSTKLVVTACGSVSATCLPFLNREIPVPVIGIVEPGVNEAIAITQTRTIAVLATNATVKSGMFRRLIERVGRNLRVIEKAWPEFIEAVERGEYHTPSWFSQVSRELESLRSQGADTVIMGCTHFSLITAFFEEAADSRIRIVDPAKACAREVKTCLDVTGTTGSGNGQTLMYVRGERSHFHWVLDMLNGVTFQSLNSFPEEYDVVSRRSQCAFPSCARIIRTK
ncbi:MAG TPA: glutamate racemase [Atribacteraceae bacterium]|nr:glutamate racemase [Atribacteraceae bacterium]